jgi:hypothetical protein
VDNSSKLKPTSPQFWDERFENNCTPWNRNGVPEALQSFAIRHQDQAFSCLIPGCGHAHELGFLAQSSWQVRAIDFSVKAVAAAKQLLGEYSHLVEHADFFEFQSTQTFNVIYERAFLCALPIDMRAAIVKRWSELLQEGGFLIGFFYIDDSENASIKGPPFSIQTAELTKLMTPYFELMDDQNVADSLSVFEGRERWKVWRRI